MRPARLFPVFAFWVASLGAADGPLLRVTPLPDGTGAIGLPPGWTVSAINSMVSAAGPEGEVDLGINVPVYTPQGAAATPFIRPSTVAPFGNPAVDAQVVLGIFWHIPPQSIQIVERSRVAWWTNGPGEMIHLTAPAVHRECLQMVLTGDTGFGTFMYYSSGVCTPPEKFEENLPLLLRIWSSWKVSDWVYQSRLRDAACSLEYINRIIRGVNRRRQHAYHEANEAWDDLIRGESGRHR